MWLGVMLVPHVHWDLACGANPCCFYFASALVLETLLALTCCSVVAISNHDDRA